MESKNLENLRKLKENLYKIPEDRLDMGIFSNAAIMAADAVRLHDSSSSCCCLLGWSPHIIEDLDKPKEKEPWWDYGNRIFTNGILGSGRVMAFLFSPRHTNSLRDAEARINHVLKYKTYNPELWEKEN